MEGAVVSYQSCPRDSGFQIKSELEWENKNHLTVRKKFLTSKLRYGKLIKSPAKAANKGEARRADLRAEKSLKKL